MPISQDQITTLDQLEEKLTLALTDLLLLRDSNNEDYKVKASTILQAAVDKAGADLIGGNVESGNTKAVTGNEVANIMSSLPNDAVLHYSFDEIPDIPDGTADLRYLNGNTYEVAFSHNGTVTTNAYVEGDNLIHKSNVNGNANYKSDVTTSLSRGMYQYLAAFAGKIVILEIYVKTDNLLPCIETKETEQSSMTRIYVLGNEPLKPGKYKITVYVPSVYSYTLTMYAQNATNYSYSEWELLSYYVGDGSYVTPIIDNVNGENNATNNGGVAVQGVSGKGAYFLNGKYATIGNYNFTDNFSISLWVNPDNNTTGLEGTILSKEYCLYLRNGSSTIDKILLGLYNTSTRGYVNYTNIADLLTTGQNHIALIKNGSNVYIYINGVKKTITSSVFANMAQNSRELYIGSTSNTRPQSIDDLLIFDRALTDSEVMALYLNKANTPKYYNRADWKLEQIEAAEEE